MQIDIIETTGLGDRSYLISDGGIGVVIDPQRDIDRVLALAEKRAVRIALVLETHLHNDYLTGGLELSGRVGADYVVPAGDAVAYDRVPAADGDVLDAGPMRLRVLHTPGHTHHHRSTPMSSPMPSTTRCAGSSTSCPPALRSSPVTASAHSVRPPRPAETPPPSASRPRSTRP